MSSTSPQIQSLIDHLHSDGRLRVWSVVITIFGDAVQPRGGTVAMSDLQDLLGAMQVESGALRTAMSRLAKEGWVTREKRGRHSFYKLSKAGEKTFVPAAEKIYRGPDAHSAQELIIAVGPDELGKAREKQNGLLEALGGTRLRNGVALFAQIDKQIEAQLAKSEFLILPATIDTLPDWVSEQLGIEDLAKEFEALSMRIKPLQEHVSKFDALQAMVVRTLLIHDWRRLALRQPDLPTHLLPSNWPGQACQERVRSLYRNLLEQSENWWNTPTPEGALTTLKRRFS